MTAADHTCSRCSRLLPPDAPAGACPRCLLAVGFASEDGAPAPQGLTPEEIAPHFPELEIVELLGRGGMGVVYKARQKSLDRTVALKILPMGERDGAEAAAFEDRFEREARALARLDHPHIVGVHEFGEREGLYFLLMEYVDGCNLREAMQLRDESGAGEFKPEQALAIVPQICDALSFAHAKGVVHRDIKPENVLIAKGGHVKIADFGLAKLVLRSPADATLTRDGQVMGTPHYMAPEQIESPTHVDHRADIYSLGVVFYEMLTGELPLGRFDAPSQKVEVDVQLDQIVLRALEKQPSRRYQSAADVKTGVTSIGSATAGRRNAPQPRDAAGESRPAGRISKLAVAGMVGTPLSVLLAMLPGVVGGGMSISFAWVFGALSLAVVSWCASIAAWVRIHQSAGRLRGVAFAVIGTILPVFTCVPVGLGSYFFARVPAYEEQPGRHSGESPFEPAVEPPPPVPPGTPPDER